MQPLSDVQTLPQLWLRVFGQVDLSQPFLVAESPAKRFHYTYKRLWAEAHCLASFLREHHPADGFAVMALAENTSAVAVLEFGAQLAGGTMLVLSAATEAEDLDAWLRAEAPPVAFCSAYRLYQAHRECWDAYVARGGLLLCLTAPEDQLAASDRLVTYEAALEQGKELWRPHRGAITRAAEAIPPERTAARFAGPVPGQVTSLTHREFLVRLARHVQDVPDQPREVKQLAVASPAEPLHRFLGLYHALCERRMLVLADDLLRPPPVRGSARFLAVAMPAQLDHCMQAVERGFRNKHRFRGRFFASALALNRRMRQQRKRGAKPPFLLTRRFLLARRYVLRFIRRHYLRHLEGVLTQAPQGEQAPGKELFQATETPLLGVRPLDEPPPE